MTINDALRIITASLSLLPPRYDSTEARAMLIAIALQESDLRHRQQIGGPARGYWQFEHIGVRGVLEHSATAQVATELLKRLDYDTTSTAAYGAIIHNDVLAGCLARLALFRLPQPLPGRSQSDEAWRQYIQVWRPGKPHPDKWSHNYARAWDHV